MQRRGAVASLILLGVAFATGPSQTAAASPLPPAPIMSPADVAQLRALMAQAVTTLRRFLGDRAACPGSAELIHPVWPR